MSRFFLPFACLLVLGPLLPAAEVDKRAYTLANPTPENLLRELSTDRPDATEGPTTVDAGHLQLEMSFGEFTRDRQGGVRTTESSFAPFNLRLGLLHNVEAGLFFDPYIRVTEKPRVGPQARVRGVGDTTLRLKYNLWGNDGGESAFGVFVDVKFPTAARGLGNDKVDGALTLPFTADLGAGWDMGGMTSIAAEHDGSRHRPVWTNSLTVGHDLVEHVGAFVEIVSQAGDGPHLCTFNTGIAWEINRNLKFDVGGNFGVSHSAPDFAWFVGMTRRF